MNRIALAIELTRIKAQHKQGYWPSDLLMRAHALLHEQPSNKTLKTYIDVRHSLTGFDKESLDELISITSTLEGTLSKKLLCRIQALLLEYERTDDIKLQDITANPHLVRYPNLLSYTSDNGTNANIRCMAKSLRSSTQPLNESLSSQQPISRISVVGNAPTELGKNQKSIIDSSDLVFRFNRANTSADYQSAYGTHTDYWVISPSCPIDPDNVISTKIVISGISPFDKPTRYWQSLAKLPNVQFYIFPKSIWYNLVSQLQAPPSAGLLCLATLMQWRDDNTSIESYGINTGKITSQNHYADNNRRSHRHNWKREAQMVKELLCTEQMQTER